MFTRQDALDIIRFPGTCPRQPTASPFLCAVHRDPPQGASSRALRLRLDPKLIRSRNLCRAEGLSWAPVRLRQGCTPVAPHLCLRRQGGPCAVRACAARASHLAPPVPRVLRGPSLGNSAHVSLYAPDGAGSSALVSPSLRCCLVAFGSQEAVPGQGRHWHCPRGGRAHAERGAGEPADQPPTYPPNSATSKPGSAP